MRKTIVISSLALAMVVGNVNAKETPKESKNYKVEKVVSNVNAFCISIARGDTETVEKLITLGENINEKSNGMTPLMYAARFNRVDVLRLLIANGANLKARSEKGFTALKYAKLSGAKDAEAILEQAIAESKGKKS
jgi:ankyrin repeat protein